MSAIAESELTEVIAAAGGITQVARSLGVSYVAVWSWATGRSLPRPASLARLRELPRTPLPVPLRRHEHRPRTHHHATAVEAASLVEVASLIAKAGGTTRVARALGITPTAVVSWRRGRACPTPAHLALLKALPPMPPLPPGRPARPVGPESALLDQVVALVGTIAGAARRLRMDRRTLHRCLARKRAVAPSVVERAREILAQ